MPPPSLARDVHRIPFDGAPGRLPSKEVVGSKAHNLMRMAARGLSVPPGFVLGTGLCRAYMAKGDAALRHIDEVLDGELQRLGDATQRHFGDPKRPLLLSVRSGAAVSMPGMMETVLNVGINEATLRGVVRMTGNPRLAQDCRRRLVEQYGEVVQGIASSVFADRLSAFLEERGAPDLDSLDTRGLADLADACEREFEAAAGRAFPADPRVQLRRAVESVLRSWSSARAQAYRDLNRIPHDLGTAVIVQAMAYGNRGPRSGAGVGFTRDPADGSNCLYVDYLPNAQGEDVVAGRRRALGIDELERRAPDAYRALVAARAELEREFRDMQDFEFTVEEGRLLLLQCRAGKRTPQAALQIAHDLVAEEMLEPAEALALLAGLDIERIETVSLVRQDGEQPLATGTPAGPGVAIGAAVFDPARVPDVKRPGLPVVLVRRTAETGDISALAEAAALVTAEGARASHAAVVARQLGKTCVVGCAGLAIDLSGRSATFGGVTVQEGDMLAVDGANGCVYRGAHDVVAQRPDALLDEVQRWRAAGA